MCQGTAKLSASGHRLLCERISAGWPVQRGRGAGISRQWATHGRHPHSGDGSYRAFVRDALGSVRAGVAGSGFVTGIFDYLSYATMPNVQGGHLTRLARNRDWIWNVMDEGRVIVNLGRDPDRLRQGAPISPFYQAELEEVIARGHTRIVPGAWPVVP